jgi:pteridine reductase
MQAKVALVTGAARRIGREIARDLHGRGYDIALHYRSSTASAEALADELCEVRDGSCRLFRADLATAVGARQLGQAVADCYPCLDLLVNNASGFDPTPIETCTEAQFDAMLGANLKGPYFLVQALLAPLRRASAGSIVNILDVHVEHPLRNYNAYCAAKAGLVSLTRSLALELGPDLRVNGVAPGAILWPDGEEAYDSQTRRETVEKTPLKRTGDPSDIARTVSFLACDAPFITGQVIAVDGGRGLAG